MSEPPAGLRLAAPAKLNLSLRITGRRADGFHELAGLFVLLELGDQLLLEPGASGLRVDADAGITVPAATGDNLAWRGLVAGLDREPLDACLRLSKHVPAAAGLGGGSSDAAAAWRLGRRWRGVGDRPEAADLEILAEIGADVPFFASQCAAAWVTGIGERVAPVAVPADAPREIVLVHPPFELSTAAVFAQLRPDEWGTGASTAADALGAADVGNDLLAPARRLRPELDEVRRLVLSAGVEPRMTGSGPTLFALIDDPERADAVAARLRRASLRVGRTRLRDEPARIEPVEAAEEGEQ
jgi:4-diphosphocytidyl-2-C-methyl-D-erythritol kinase